MVQVTLKQLPEPAALAATHVLMAHAAKGLDKEELRVMKNRLLGVYKTCDCNTMDGFTQLFSGFASEQEAKGVDVQS